MGRQPTKGPEPTKSPTQRAGPDSGSWGRCHQLELVTHLSDLRGRDPHGVPFGRALSGQPWKAELFVEGSYLVSSERGGSAGCPGLERIDHILRRLLS